MTDMIFLKSVLDNKLLLDGSLTTSARKVRVLVGEGWGNGHALEKVLVIRFSNWVKRVYGALGIERVLNLRLVFFGYIQARLPSSFMVPMLSLK